jgi:RcsF protein
MNIKLFISPLIILLASCSSHYVSTNIDKDNFTEYFSANSVTVYPSEKDIEGRYKLVSIVEGQDCQIKAHHAVPNKANARTEARREASKKQANGIVFSQCTLLSHERLAQLNNTTDAQQCHAIVICYAKAYAINVKK